MNELPRAPKSRPTTQAAEGVPRLRWTLDEFERLIELAQPRPGDRALSIDSWIENTHTDVEHAPYFAAALGRIYDPTAGDAAQMALLRRWRLRFIVLNRFEPDARIGGPIAVLQPRFVRRHLRLLHRDATSELYVVRDL